MKKDCWWNRNERESCYYYTHPLYNTDNKGCKWMENVKNILNLKDDEICECCKHYISERDKTLEFVRGYGDRKK